MILTTKKNIEYIIDDEDFELVSKYHWYTDNKGYLRIERNRKKIKLHRLLTNCPKGLTVDHINGNKLDNRRSNLRICTNQENVRNVVKRKNNKSGFKGVYWHTQSKCWRAKITVNGKCITVGGFKIKEDAAKAYDKAAIKYFGEFANLNYGKNN